MTQVAPVAENLQSLQSKPLIADVLNSLDDTTLAAVEGLLSSLNEAVKQTIVEACEELDAQGADVSTLVAVLRNKPVDVTLDERFREAFRDLLAAAKATRDEVLLGAS
jgi:hypothetical protein